MDPVSFEHLLFELRSANAETVDIPVEKLTPGCVIASGEWRRHVVTDLPIRLNQHGTRAVPVRHLGGGHTLRPHLPGRSCVKIYRTRMQRPSGFQVPVVPHCVIPGEPSVGDRIAMQHHEGGHLGVVPEYTYDGERWRSIYTTARGRTEVSYTSTHGLRAITSPSGSPLWQGCFVYLPAAHERPHLYIDGRAVPARYASELQPQDVILVPGGGRLEVEGRYDHADGRTLYLHTLTPSSLPPRYLEWAREKGDRTEAHDSGRLGLLYATEPRSEELVSAADLHVGDTVIAAWGTVYSNVATVDEVWRQPLRAAMHVHSHTSDGRRVRQQTGLDNRYMILERAVIPGYAGII